MSGNSLPQTIESLHIELQRLTFHRGPEGDLAVEALKCVLLNRIASLEAASAILQSLTPAQTQIAEAPVQIVSLPVSALEALEEAALSLPLQKLD